MTLQIVTMSIVLFCLFPGICSLHPSGFYAGGSHQLECTFWCVAICEENLIERMSFDLGTEGGLGLGEIDR